MWGKKVNQGTSRACFNSTYTTEKKHLVCLLQTQCGDRTKGSLAERKMIIICIVNIILES